VISGICDTPERIPARIYGAIRLAVDREARAADPPPDCPCCSFWRGAIFGGAVSAGAAALLVSLLVR